MKNFQEVNKQITVPQIIVKIKKSAADQGLDLLRVFEDHDKLKSGFYINILRFQL